MNSFEKTGRVRRAGADGFPNEKGSSGTGPNKTGEKNPGDMKRWLSGSKKKGGNMRISGKQDVKKKQEEARNVGYQWGQRIQ